MINIQYKHGEMNIDIVMFLINRNINDIRDLCKIISISPQRLDIKNEVCYTINTLRRGNIDRPCFMKKKDDEYFEKKLNKMIEFLDKYIKE